MKLFQPGAKPRVSHQVAAYRPLFTSRGPHCAPPHPAPPHPATSTAPRLAPPLRSRSTTPPPLHHACTPDPPHLTSPRHLHRAAPSLRHSAPASPRR
ncbi:MAG: hypothetical protein IJQ22_04565, partial [Bacteroidales bacterium]|nr:hypothetical protein [Bacteroidales bacterium]